jgi:hypothetical protein
MAGRLPARLLSGRLRTSTLLLSLLFAAVLALYLEVRPPPAGTVSSSDGSRPAQAPPPTASVPTTTPPTSTATSAPETTGTTGAPTTSAARATTTRTPAPTSTTPGTSKSSATPGGPTTSP